MTLTDFLNNHPIESFSLGLLAGALVSAIGLYIAYRCLDEWHQGERIKAFYQALYEELKEIGNAYDEEVGVYWKEFEKNGGGEIFPVNLSLTQDYFTIYHSNANLIGQIPNSKLRRKIVKTYTSLKVLIDYYNQNNRILERHEEKELVNQTVLEFLNNYYKQSSGVPGKPEKRELTEETVEYESDELNFTKRLQKRHHRFERLQKKLLKMLEKELSKLSYEKPAQTISILRSSDPTQSQLS